ncbi:MAG: FecR domain-containing protein, partial [Opitutaceae bacterium]|nr:FecR domain-containing protein [Verrucomicrobiales bacterium]
MKPLALFLFSFVLLFTVTARAQSDTETNRMVVLTIDGSADILRAGGVDWAKVGVNQALSFGDRLRTAPNSRATVRMTDMTVVRVDQSTTFEVQPPPAQKTKPVLNLRNGSVYLYSRDRSQEFQIRTPVAAGAIRGTEFNLTVGADGRTQLTLLDGEVDLSNEQGTVTLTSGEQGTVDAGQAPRKTAVIDAVSIIQWALYYPGVLNPDDLALPADVASAVGDSLKAYRSGDLLGALAAYPAGRAPGVDSEKVYLAAVNLSVGQVGAAQELLKGLKDDQARNLGAALNKVIAAVQGRKITVTNTPATSTELMADSYYYQSQSDLEGARKAAVEAAAKAPGFGFATARLAEMEFSFGRNDEALKSVEESLKVAPRNAQALALKGFLLGAKKDTSGALAAFDQAIAADGSLANAWLGRGLMKISGGNGEDGRKDLQVAATLEPNRSILRSYLGKAYSYTSDAERAGKELDLARKLDPKDPTPWLYSALIDQQQNRVNRSVESLEKSQSLNENRSVFRSRLLLDQDRAVRSANLASIYRDAGMTYQSVREATRAVDSDYANYSAHLFLANSYDELRDPRQVDLRYETPWLSELLVANLLMPVGGGSLSQNVSQQEYSSLFEGDHL